MGRSAVWRLVAKEWGNAHVSCVAPWGRRGAVALSGVAPCGGRGRKEREECSAVCSREESSAVWLPVVKGRRSTQRVAGGIRVLSSAWRPVREGGEGGVQECSAVWLPVAGGIRVLSPLWRPAAGGKGGAGALSGVAPS